MTTLDPSWIIWDADEHSTIRREDLEWRRVPNYPLSRIGGNAFLEKMKDYLDTEIASHLKGAGLPLNATIEEVMAAGEHRLAGWMALDKDIANGLPFQEEVHIPEVPCEDEPDRNCIGDGWHRIGAAIKHGRVTIPAFVGRKKVA